MQILTYKNVPVYFLKNCQEVIIPIGFSISHDPNGKQEILVKTASHGTIPLDDLRYANQTDEKWFGENCPEYRSQMEIKNFGNHILLLA